MQTKPFYCPDTQTTWASCIALVDMVAFFPSCEQLDFPELRGQPVAVINGEKGTAIISSSYEARAFGIKTGMRLGEAFTLCPALIVRPSRPDRYAEVSAKVMHALMGVSPDLKVQSIDECYIDLKPVLSLYGSVQIIADKLRQSVFASSGGLRCSIGISEGQLTAKYCARQKGEITIVPPNKIKQAMANSPVEDICGVGSKIKEHLNKYGVYYCKEIEKLPMSILSQRFGDIGRRLYSTCLGHDPMPLDLIDHDHKSMGHGKVLPAVTDRNTIRGIMRQLTERLTRRLRHNEQTCTLFYIGYKTSQGWIEKKYKVQPATNATEQVWLLVRKHFKNWTKNQPLYQLQITALTLQDEHNKQMDLFEVLEKPDNPLDKLKDQINEKIGKSAIRTGTEMLADQTNMVPVIAFNFDAKGKKNSL